MTTPVKSIDVNATIQEAAGQMDAKNISALITTEKGKHVDIVTYKKFYTNSGCERTVTRGPPFENNEYPTLYHR